MIDEGRAWFAPKRFGIGAGLPLRWQGWVVVAIYGAAVAAALALFPHDRRAQAALIVFASMLFLVVTARTTRGGWRWRWGEEE